MRESARDAAAEERERQVAAVSEVLRVALPLSRANLGDMSAAAGTRQHRQLQVL